MTGPIVLGFLQGIVEWLPVSSEGVVAATYAVIFDKPLDEAVGYALWLHVGTAPSVIVVFRREVVGILREVVGLHRRPSRLLLYLVISTIVSGLVGFPLLLGLREVSSAVGVTATGLIGGFMLITGAVQMRRRQPGVRDRDDLSPSDAIAAGVAQGVAVVPGLSRSGMTIALLLARRIERREALVLSFLMSVPASLAAALYAGLDSGFNLDSGAIVAAFVAFVVGLVTIRVVLAFAQRTNLGLFVLAVGAAMLAGALWEAFL